MIEQFGLYILVFIVFLIIFRQRFTRQNTPIKSATKSLITLALTNIPNEAEILNILTLITQFNIVLIVDKTVAAAETVLPLRAACGHKFLVSENSEGRVSIVRQLQPLLHLDCDGSVVERLQGKVQRVCVFASLDETAALLQAETLANKT